jgi:IS5 family transposase
VAIINFQPEFRPALPCVFGTKDYHEFRATLIEIDRILTTTGLEDRFIERRIASYEEPISPRQLQRHCKTLRLALRHNILLAITGLSFRELSRRMADSHLFQWFTHTGFVDAVRPVSKSTLERFEKMFEPHDVAGLVHDLNCAVAAPLGARQLLYRETALRFDQLFADTTCVKNNIHFPVDRVLLRDATRTLIKAVILIRTQGLKPRMDRPERFLREMNKLCIEMTHTRKKKDAKKVRKQVFRRMKKLMKTVEVHANNYHALLEERWQETGWSKLETQVVLDRIENILDQLPQAIDQAHERIIGERRVANTDKILSLYEPDVHVLVRGKAGAEVEFGNGLYLAEQSDGLIVDWDFMKDQPPADSQLVKPSLKRIRREYGAPESYTGDRGFHAEANDLALEELDIINGICPRSVASLHEKLTDEGFCLLQKRRGGTEARIGIFKNAYLGKPLRSKGFKNRQIRIEWCILAHNLWKMGRIAAQTREKIEAELAATG